jgi:hypothetical protein
MNPGTYNLLIYQNATYLLTFLWTAGVCCGSGTVGATPLPVNLTGYTAEMQFKQSPYATAVLYDCVASGDIVLGGAAGTITLTIPSSATSTFTWWNGVYDLILISAGGIATPLLSGTVTVTPGVST